MPARASACRTRSSITRRRSPLRAVRSRWSLTPRTGNCERGTRAVLIDEQRGSVRRKVYAGQLGGVLGVASQAVDISVGSHADKVLLFGGRLTDAILGEHKIAPRRDSEIVRVF